MATPSNHLSEIYRVIDERFSGSEIVSVLPSNKTAPDIYVITFHVPGKTADAQGKVSETNRHKIELVIPFGFPKFPPKCKPLTKIFHPDFIAENISIEEYWEKNDSLPDLICYIAEMVTGQHYSMNERALNREALQWYTDHNTEFPLSVIDWKKETDVLSIEAEGGVEEVLVIDDDFELKLGSDDGELNLTHDLNFDVGEEFSLQLEKVGENDADSSVFFPFGNDDGDQDHERRLRGFAAIRDKREFMRLKRELEGDVEFRDLYAETVRVLQNTDRLYSEAKSKEKRGDTEKALALYKKVYAEVADYPSILNDITRIEQPDPLADDYAKESRKRAMMKQAEAEAEVGEDESLPPKAKVRRRATPSFDRTTRSLILGMVVILSAATIGVVGLKLMAKSKVSEADTFLDGCRRVLADAAYKNAKELCVEAKTAAESISFFHGADKRRILNEIDAILSSNAMEKGLADKVVIDGKEYRVEEAKIIFRLKKVLQQANRAYENQRYGEAAKHFSSVLKLSHKVNFLDGSAKQGIEEKYNIGMVRQGLLILESRKKRKKWSGIRAAIRDAESRVSKLPREERARIIEDLAEYRVLARIGEIGEEMEIRMNEGRWSEVTSSYQKANTEAQQYYRNGQSGIEIFKEELSNLKEKVLQVSLYKAIDQANLHFASGRWNEAINAYGKAIELINDPQYALLGADQVQENNKLLKKLILKASIVKEEETVKSQLDNSELKQARKTYWKLLNLIRKSSFTGDPEFNEARKEIEKKVREIDRQVFLNDKIGYLQRNYKKFFLKFYTDTRSSYLQKPKAVVVKETGTALFFHLTCIEKKPGSRASRLLLKYQYNKNTKSWSIYTD